MPWSATRKKAQSSHIPVCSTTSKIRPSRASLSRTALAAISEYGPPSWNAESVSVKLTQVKTGRVTVGVGPDAAELLDGGVVRARRPAVVLARPDEPCGRVG